MTPISSTAGDRGQQSVNCKVSASNFPASNRTHDSLDKELPTQEVGAHVSINHFSRTPGQDLLGQTQQTSSNRNCDDEEHRFKDVVETISSDQEWMSAASCPVHKAFLAGVHSKMDAQPGQAGELKHMPMDRYLAEGVTERYALFSLSSTSAGEDWARYSECICAPRGFATSHV